MCRAALHSNNVTNLMAYLGSRSTL
jgi:hypothetical protein